MNRTMPAMVQPKRRFFPPSCMAQATPTARGQLRSRAETDSRSEPTIMGRMPNSWVSGRQTQLNIWPPCALNTTGSAKQAMRAKTAHTEAPASHAASRGSPPRSVSEVFIKPSALRCMERLLGEGGSFWRKGPPSLNCQRSSRPSLPLRRRSFLSSPDADFP